MGFCLLLYLLITEKGGKISDYGFTYFVSSVIPCFEAQMLSMSTFRIIMSSWWSGPLNIINSPSFISANAPCLEVYFIWIIVASAFMLSIWMVYHSPFTFQIVCWHRLSCILWNKIQLNLPFVNPALSSSSYSSAFSAFLIWFTLCLVFVYPIRLFCFLIFFHWLINWFYFYLFLI